MSSTGTDYVTILQILPIEDGIWKSPRDTYEWKYLPLPLHDSTHCVNMSKSINITVTQNIYTGHFIIFYVITNIYNNNNCSQPQEN
jgi:hypothetical protein